MEINFTMCLPSERESVPVVRQLARRSMVDLGVVQECVEDVELALTEAVTNVLVHASETDDDYEVDIQVNHATCEIRVRDAGRGFDHDALTDGAGDVGGGVSAERGRGIALMRAVVDNVSFTSQPEAGTVVHLVKKLSLEDDAVLRRLAPGGSV
jgi:serine/threonine-protein kinase RsbW